MRLAKNSQSECVRVEDTFGASKDAAPAASDQDHTAQANLNGTDGTGGKGELEKGSGKGAKREVTDGSKGEKGKGKDGKGKGKDGKTG
mmetsp:Transcript_12293/g.13384  ORF Transcript_12293/g.13384 Transcript_12293/m.13384 type:complete len:88 (-) Transcript_12293:13-276(-)